ncbi:hypothetical protein ADIWIN_0564 [Winogradskyella psychrotolerans RS-3]|uniref:Lipoprotein n=1 Tax=Winogradskyella psychrotolerans RS-3 TaxID=641526 RepID=S7XEM6_9FLAO|nr:hypothetical protein [Winogradskyella psychrotolerans]EPR74463.1 hypothetical protein ADIWIN_0564 [Winogradskyella psychrotolerans RS-3]
MKITIISIICLLVLVLILAGCSKYIGIPKKKAARNLEEYLQNKYKGKLAYSDLSLFFNAATMDPNMYGMLIYDKDIPEIEFYTHLNLKNILENDTLPMYPIADAMTVDDLYKRALTRYETRQAVIADFKEEIPEIMFSTEIIDLNFKRDIEPNELEAIVARFIDRLSQSIEELESAYQFSLRIRTTSHPEGFMIIPLEVEDSKWHANPMLLSEKAVGFESLKTMILKNIQAKLETPYPYYKTTEHSKIYIDKTTLSRGAWVQYLEDKRIVNNGKGKWINPQTGLYVVYFDLDTKFIYRGELLTDENDTMSYREELRQIMDTVEAEGIRTK